MVEVEEIELDLALSIGGSSFKPSNSKPEARVSNSCDGVRVVEPCEKREIQALRRMEAKKKREQRRERVRETCEPEWEQDFKREKKTECRNGVSGAWMNNTTPFRVHHFATTVQYLPLNNNNNGFLLPCWVGGEKNVGGGGSGVDGVNNGLGGDTKVKSNGSSRCSSSVVSDYQSSSREDGGSTDSHSHSVHSLAEPTQMKNNNTSKEIGTTQPDQESASASSNSMMRPKQGTNNIITKKPQQQQPKPKQNPTTSPDPITTTTTMQSIDQKPLSNNENSMGKPPKPVISHHIISSLPPPPPQMPYVSTKGHNGKTVNGFLYRYTKSEVSIVCVCHGSTFSPAEFVQHAGGTDITHPLRHITVVPSSFG